MAVVLEFSPEYLFLGFTICLHSKVSSPPLSFPPSSLSFLQVPSYLDPSDDGPLDFIVS